MPGLVGPDDAMRAALERALHPRYVLRDPVRTGGMASVHLAWDLELRKPVAIKVLAPALARDPACRHRFAQEAWAAARIQHGNVVQVYDVGEADQEPPLPYLVLQYVEGTALDQYLAERGRLSERRVRQILRDVAAGLAAAHGCHVVHRDIKPGNILIEHQSGRAYVADFGISAAVASRPVAEVEAVAAKDVVYGTPAYMSPEQTLGEPADTATDVYSLGLVAYELLSGRLPFAADSAT